MPLLDNPAGSLGDGRKTVAKAKTAEVLAAATPCSWVVITAEDDNEGTVVVGGSTVVAEAAKRQGIPLTKSQSTPRLDVGDLAKVYLDVTKDGEGVTFLYGIA